MAIINRRPVAGAVIRADHGVNFAYWAFVERAPARSLVPSMQTIIDCYD